MNIIICKTYPFQDVKQCKGLASGEVIQYSSDMYFVLKINTGNKMSKVVNTPETLVKCYSAIPPEMKFA